MEYYVIDGERFVDFRTVAYYFGGKNLTLDEFEIIRDEYGIVLEGKKARRMAFHFRCRFKKDYEIVKEFLKTVSDSNTWYIEDDENKTIVIKTRGNNSRMRMKDLVLNLSQCI